MLYLHILLVGFADLFGDSRSYVFFSALASAGALFYF